MDQELCKPRSCEGCAELSTQVKAKDKWINELLTKVDDLNVVIEALEANNDILKTISDICPECGYTEFLCGHNKRD